MSIKYLDRISIAMYIGRYLKFIPVRYYIFTDILFLTYPDIFKYTKM